MYLYNASAINFVVQANKQFDFRTKFRSIIGKTNDNVEKVKDSYEVKDKKDLNTALGKVMNINSIKFIDFILQYLKKAEYSLKGLKEEENLMLLMFHYTVWDCSSEGKLVYYLYKFRSENGITSPFYFLGKGIYVSNNGSKPISITFEMERPIPTFLLKKSNKVVDVI